MATKNNAEYVLPKKVQGNSGKGFIIAVDQKNHCSCVDREERKKKKKKDLLPCPHVAVPHQVLV